MVSLTQPPIGDTSWGGPVNTNFSDIEAALNAGSGVPTGTIIMFGATSAPTGWLLCDGSPVSRATYSALFSVVSTTFGTGDGSTTFNVPDMRSRSPLGTGQGSGLSSRSLAATVGAETYTLSINEMPAHYHQISQGYNPSGTSNQVLNDYWNSAGTVYTNTVGGSAAHNTMHPCLTVTFIIRT